MTLYALAVPTGIAPIRADRYIEKALPALPGWALREAFSRRDVKADGVRIKPDTLLTGGESLRVYTQAAEKAPLAIVYEDENILLLDKPEGVSVHEDHGVGTTMLELARQYAGSDKLNLCHRLDNKTSGLLLLSKNVEAEAVLREAFQSRAMEKTYTCLLKGTPKQHEAVCEAYLIKNAETARVRVITKQTPGAFKIVTGYRVLEAGDICRAQVDLLTGRTHQIRAHMAFLGHPILGDDVYGDRAFNKQKKAGRLMLCASRLTFHVEGSLAYLDGKSFSITVPF